MALRFHLLCTPSSTGIHHRHTTRRETGSRATIIFTPPAAQVRLRHPAFVLKNFISSFFVRSCASRPKFILSFHSRSPRAGFCVAATTRSLQHPKRGCALNRHPSTASHGKPPLCCLAQTRTPRLCSRNRNDTPRVINFDILSYTFES